MASPDHEAKKPMIPHSHLRSFVVSVLVVSSAAHDVPAFAQQAKAKPTKKPATTTTTSAPLSAPEAPPNEDKGPTSAEVTEEKPARRISIAAMVGVGINETKIKDDAGNELRDGVGTQGAGFGLRAGYTLPINVYLGAALVYHLGGTKEEQHIKYSGSSIYVGPEVGYDFVIGPVVARPYLGFGYGSATAKAEVTGHSIERSEGGLAIWPGAMLRYPIDMFFVGADARYAVITGTDKITNANGFGAFAAAGASF